MYEISYSSSRSSRYHNYFTINEKLTIETKIIGYRNQGECILIFIRVDGVIAFSALTDCYMTASVDKISDILDEYHVSKLNFLCWTHPDFDHSRGMKKIIQKYVDENTQIWIPEGIESYSIKCSEKVRELFCELKECVVGYGAYNVYTVSDKKDLLCYDTYCFAKGYEEYVLKITAYAPNSRLIRKQNYLDQFVKNNHSIFFILELGNVKIFLTGDIEDETIDKLPQGVSDYAHIIKIPHHGSDTSTRILETCRASDVSCSTVYRVGKVNLPLQEVLGKYALNSDELYCTGSMDANKEQYEYGILTVYTDVLEERYTTAIEGNAELISKNETR